MREETTLAAAPNLVVHTSRTAADAVIALDGELDLASAPSLEAVLDGLPLMSIRRVILDLSALTFMDARGLRQVLKFHYACVQQAVALTIEPGPRGVQRVFELTHCDRILPFAA